jgi:ketosteroid isomerase-like protein
MTTLSFRLALPVLVALGVLALAQAQTPDLPAAVAAIMNADREFNRAVADRSRERFLTFIAETAVFNGGTPNEARGHKAILESWSAFFEKDGPTLTWEPTRGEVLVGGDVGVTIGSWVRKGRTPDGKPTEARGQYTTTWLKQKDGSWKVVFDTGSNAP